MQARTEDQRHEHANVSCGALKVEEKLDYVTSVPSEIHSKAWTAFTPRRARSSRL